MPTDIQPVPFPALIGDIGGTNARFAVVQGPDGPVTHIPTVATADHAAIDDAIRVAVIEKGGHRPKSAVLALAGPIEGDEVPLTNSHWVVAPRRLVAAFGIDDVILLNDFEALSLSLPGLKPADVEQIGRGAALPNSARVVIGPGTGLGAGALIHARGFWIPVPGEGGHVDLAPISDADMALWPHLEHQDGRIAGETLLCGSGLVRLYRGVAAWKGVEPRLSDPAAISTAGLAGTDPAAVESVALFAEYLGRLAGNMALIFAARGGVYIAGGISGHIAPVLKSGRFREAFINKYPHREMLDRIPTALITKPFAALDGIADFVCRPDTFGVDLQGRRWQS